jgi:hypothetical protein
MLSMSEIVQVYASSEPKYTIYFNQDLLSPVYDEEYIQNINGLLLELKSLISNPEPGIANKDKYALNLVIKSNHIITILEEYMRFLKHPVHINEFKDKYGNKFIQARTSLMDKSTKKLKNISAYVGSYTDYPKGIQSPEAILKGRMLARKKLEAFFQLK